LMLLHANNWRGLSKAAFNTVSSENRSESEKIDIKSTASGAARNFGTPAFNTIRAGANLLNRAIPGILPGQASVPSTGAGTPGAPGATSTEPTWAVQQPAPATPDVSVAAPSAPTVVPPDVGTGPDVQTTDTGEAGGRPPAQGRVDVHDAAQMPEEPAGQPPADNTGAPDREYIFKYVNPAGEPYEELVGVGKSIFDGLVTDENKWNAFLTEAEKVGTVQEIFDELANPNTPPEKRDALYSQLRSEHPDLFKAVTWAAAIKKNPQEAAANPTQSFKHIKTLFEFGALRYATRGGQLIKKLKEAGGDTKEINSIEQLILLTLKLEIATRYASIYSKALGDQQLTPEDLDLVYYNFASESGLGDLRTPPQYEKQKILDWFTDPNVDPLPKAGLLIGIPLFLVGIVQMLTQGFSPGALMMTLLGGAGMLFGGRDWFSAEREVAPSEPIIRGELTNPYAVTPEQDSQSPPGQVILQRGGQGQAAAPQVVLQNQTQNNQGAQTGSTNAMQRGQTAAQPQPKPDQAKSQ